MKARTRSAVTTLALLALAAGVVAYAWFGVERENRAEKAKKEAEEQLFSFDTARVKELAVETQAGSVRLVRSGPQAWRITSPVEAEADAAAAGAMLDRLSTLRRRSRIAAPDAGTLAPFGLGKPRGRIAFTLEDGRTETLALGEENSFDGSVFVQPSSGAVEAVGGDVRYLLEKGLSDLRERRIFPVQERDLSRIEVTGPSGPYTLERSGEEWRIVAPVAGRADREAARKVLDSVRDLRATSFIDAPGPDRDYGLDRPTFTVRITAAGATRSADIGNPPRTGKAAATVRYARPAGTRAVAVVPPEQVVHLDQPLGLLRDKTVVRFEVPEVRAVRFQMGGETFEVQKGGADRGEEWRLASPGSGPVKDQKVTSLLNELSALQAYVVADETGNHLAEHGLDRPARVVTLLGEGGKELGRLELGSSRNGRVAARGSASPRIVEVEEVRLARLPRNSKDLE
jgi:hypothetical protein